MPAWTYPIVLLAGIGGGITGSAAGVASLVSYPVLLAVGLPPVSANVSNTVALIFGGVGAVSGSREELKGQGPNLRPLIGASLAGGAVGSVLLLVASEDSFKFVVPWLIAGASGAILLPRRPVTVPRGHRHESALIGGVFVIGIYGGYFGAAAGILMLALVLAMTSETVPRANAKKNVLSIFFNAIAALTFILFGPVRWLVVVPLGVGFLIGGRLGPTVVRRARPALLRAFIATAGIGLAIALGLQAYR